MTSARELLFNLAPLQCLCGYNVIKVVRILHALLHPENPETGFSSSLVLTAFLILF